MLLIDKLVPYVAGATRVEIAGAGGSVLATASAGPASPTVRIISPNGGEILPGDPITVTWTASDADNDPLTFNVQYSPDNGATWEMVAQNVSGNSVVIGAVNIVGGAQARFRVWATDGIHTASDESDAPFAVPNRVPTVEITRPTGNVTVVVSQTVALAVAAYDVDTGSMSGNRVQWSSNIDGPLGSGAELAVATLSAGVHTITARADDGKGGVASDKVQVTVVHDMSEAPPPDALRVGPLDIAFEPKLGQTEATLFIDNPNQASVIAWQATPSELWVQLGAHSGMTPDEVAVTFQNTGLAPGVHYATITLTSPDLPPQTVLVHVQVTVAGRLYLPLVIR
jgi:hypothetical protein